MFGFCDIFSNYWLTSPPLQTGLPETAVTDSSKHTATHQPSTFRNYRKTFCCEGCSRTGYCFNLKTNTCPAWDFYNLVNTEQQTFGDFPFRSLFVALVNSFQVFTWHSLFTLLQTVRGKQLLWDLLQNVKSENHPTPHGLLIQTPHGLIRPQWPKLLKLQ